MAVHVSHARCHGALDHPHLQEPTEGQYRINGGILLLITLAVQQVFGDAGVHGHAQLQRGSTRAMHRWQVRVFLNRGTPALKLMKASTCLFTTMRIPLLLRSAVHALVTPP